MQNPLVELSFDIPFDRIAASDVEPAVDALLAAARAAIEAIASSREVRTYSNTLGALEDATEALEHAITVVSHLESVVTTPSLRAAYNAVQPRVSEFFAAIPLHEGLYRALQAYARTPDAAALDPIRARFLAKTIDEFRRHGAELPDDKKARLAGIERELASLTTKFSENVVDATNAFELLVTDEARLAGIPDGDRAALREAAERKGVPGHRLTLSAPVLTAVLTYAEDRSLREALYRAHQTRATAAPHDNRPLIRRILELRHEKAALLGHADFSDLVLADRMAKTGARAAEFLDDLARRVRPAFERENAELVEFRRELEGPTAPRMEPWDVAYYAEKLRRTRFDFDEEALRAYFPADRVLEGLFATVTRLYGVRIEAHDAPVWHESVQAYAVVEPSGTRLATFYVDLYPRETKRDGAWMNGVVQGLAGKPCVGLFCANVTPPVHGKPALLRHREVETLFHEFGHLLHHVFSQVPVRSLAGTNVAWDFVELPSQIMENWCWERASLDLFARHHETGATIPDELFDKLLRARTFRAANHMMRQVGFGRLDLGLHRTYRPADGDVIRYARAIAQEHAATALPADYAMVASFGHLFANPVGYAAGYYSYLWAEVLEADAYSRFRAEGPLDAAVGAAFRDAILARGNSEEPIELYRRFMGRDPRLEPLLERAGLVSSAP